MAHQLNSGVWRSSRRRSQESELGMTQQGRERESEQIQVQRRGGLETARRRELL